MSAVCSSIALAFLTKPVLRTLPPRLFPIKGNVGFFISGFFSIGSAFLVSSCIFLNISKKLPSFLIGIGPGLLLDVEACINCSGVGSKSAKLGPSTSGGSPYSISSTVVDSTAPGGGLTSLGGVLDSFTLSFSSCLFLCIFQKRFLSATVNCPRRSSSLGLPLRLRERELRDLERDLDAAGLAKCLPFPLDFDRRREDDLSLLNDRLWERLRERDFRFIFRLDFERDRRGGVDEVDQLNERDLDLRWLLERDRLRFECRTDGVRDLERDFELVNDLLLYVLGGVKELSLAFLDWISDLSLYFLGTLGGGV